jgi:glycosyltransferase involved in cell wall biosynthesis
MAAAVAKNIGLENLVIWLGDLTYQTVLYHSFYNFRVNPLRLGNLLLAFLKMRLWKNLYISTLFGQKKIIVSSGSSESKVNKMRACSMYLPYPWPDSGCLRPNTDKFNRPTFILFGTLSALGSRSAFHFLVGEVYPSLAKYWGEDSFEILITGSKSPPKWVLNVLEKCPALSFLGFVDDLANLVRRCHAVLAPISVPVGNRSRIVTAMSMGCCVVAHQNTALGNPTLVSGSNCYLARTGTEFARHMRYVFEHPSQASKIGHAARSAYEREFLPSAATSKMLSILETTIEEHKSFF